MNDKENLVKEKRLILATTKNLTGLEGKIGQILKYMGDPVISQTSDFYESTNWNDMYPYLNVYEDTNKEDLPTEDMDTNLIEIGRTLSALKWGINMELSYLKESKIPIKRTELYTEWVNAQRVMSVTYKGYIVYREISGDLESYLPDDEWESSLDRIYEACKKIKKQSKIEKDAERTDEIRNDKLGLIARLREKWGI
jgi:hypothetical protein